jgi:hypothetical protein
MNSYLSTHSWIYATYLTHCKFNLRKSYEGEPTMGESLQVAYGVVLQSLPGPHAAFMWS